MSRQLRQAGQFPKELEHQLVGRLRPPEVHSNLLEPTELEHLQEFGIEIGDPRNS